MTDKIVHRYAEVASSRALDPERHRVIINDIDHLCERARVPIWAVCRPLADTCGAAEVDWVRAFRKHQSRGGGGLVLTGRSPDIEVRMSAIGGALIRNFIDARLMTLQQVSRALEDDTMPAPTALLVPNFYIRKDGGGYLSAWQIAPLLGLLMSRHSMGQLSVLYVESMTDLRGNWGEALYEHLENYYHEIRVGA